MKEKKIIFNCKSKEKEIVEIEVTQEELEERAKQEELDNLRETIRDLKQYLNSTDYVIIKLYETVVQGGSVIEMLKEYKEVLANRKEAREKINELEIKE